MKPEPSPRKKLMRELPKPRLIENVLKPRDLKILEREMQKLKNVKTLKKKSMTKEIQGKMLR